MLRTKSNVKIEHRLPFQPIANPTLEEQIAAAALKNAAKIKLTADADGNILIDPKKHPELYDWAENG